MFISYITSFLEFICYYIFMKAYVSKSHIPTKTDLFAAIIIPLILSIIPEDYAVASLIIGQIVYIFISFAPIVTAKVLTTFFYIFSLTIPFSPYSFCGTPFILISRCYKFSTPWNLGEFSCDVPFTASVLM